MLFSHAPSIFSQHISDTLFSMTFFCLRSFFSSPLAAWLSRHYSISSSAALPPSSFHLSIITSAGPIHSRKDSLKLGICCQRDSEAHAEVTCSFMPSFPAIQIKSEKNESLKTSKDTRTKWEHVSCDTLLSRWCFCNVTVGAGVKCLLISGVATSRSAASNLGNTTRTGCHRIACYNLVLKQS